MSNLKLPRKGTKYVARKAQKCNLVCNRGDIIVVKTTYTTYPEPLVGLPKPTVVVERLDKPKSKYGSATYYVDNFNENFAVASGSEGKKLISRANAVKPPKAVDPVTTFKVGDYVELKPGENGFVDALGKINVFTPRETQGRFTVMGLAGDEVMLRPGLVKLTLPYHGAKYNVNHAEMVLRLQHVVPLEPIFKVGDNVMVTEGESRYKSFKVVNVDKEALRMRSRCAYQVSTNESFSDEWLTLVPPSGSRPITAGDRYKMTSGTKLFLYRTSGPLDFATFNLEPVGVGDTVYVTRSFTNGRIQVKCERTLQIGWVMSNVLYACFTRLEEPEAKKTFVGSTGHNWNLTGRAVMPQLHSSHENAMVYVDSTWDQKIPVLHVRSGTTTLNIPLDGLKALLKLAEKQ